MKLKPAIKYTLVMICIFCQNSSNFGQVNFNLKLGTNSGYEYNVFNAHPSRTIVQDGDSIPALQSGYFQNFNVNTGLILKSKYHYFSIGGSVQKDFFPNLAVANLYRPSAKVKYTLKLSKKHHFTLSTRYNQYMTNRPEDEDEVLRPPRAYTRLQANAKYKIKLGPGSSIFAEAFVRNNVYDTDESREFNYKAKSASLSYTQRIKKNAVSKQYFKLEAAYSFRFYTDLRFNEIEDEETLEEREWKYYSLNTEYSIHWSNRFQLSTGAFGLVRKDLIQERFGYTQFQPFVNIIFKNEKFDFGVRLSHSYRVYHDLKANDSVDEFLIHQYWRGRLNLGWSPVKKLRLLCRVSLIERTRNFPDQASSFLGYRNAIATVGLQYSIF